ncbi:MAG: hypothetical protein SGJ27_21250 [Candidatus Melainabacteria bacterium]|nr:hypothetical protein [Candidatus Melainabacteria bacterium]
MLFYRVDVRESLLRNSTGRHYAKRVETIEIDMSGASSKVALELFERARHQEDRYQPESARRLYCQAAAVARRNKDYFVEAAVVMCQTMMMDGMTNGESQIQYMEQAREALEYGLYALRDQLLEARTKRSEAVEVIGPKLDLLTLIEENKQQYTMRQNMLLIAETRLNIDRHMAAGNWVQAANVARIGSQHASEQYGSDHWWNGVMLARLATALMRLQEVQQARQLMRTATTVLGEWTDYSAKDAFDFEHDLLSVVHHDILLVQTP